MASGFLRTSDFDYDLPENLIAQRPADRRDASRLMVLDRRTETIRHSTFDRLPDLLEGGDALVLNRSRVLRARLRVTRPGGGAAELLMLRPEDDTRWLALARPSRRLREGMELTVAGGTTRLTVDRRCEGGRWLVKLEEGVDAHHLMQRHGELPLPPYIRDRSTAEERYQTVYADRAGSVAAPTAGLHFTPELMDALRRKGVDTQFVTLHVGMGTFKPVTAEEIAQHTMHAEWGEVPAEVARAVNVARARGKRSVAVGTTSTRLLETALGPDGLVAWSGETNIFIYPGYRFRAVDALVTNFHLPRSTLLMLVSAFAGRDFILHAYREAVRERYRFFSFGDAMMIV